MTAAPLSAGGVGIKTWVGFVAMAVGMFLAILDTQIVASSLPEIQTGLGIPLSQLSWVQTAYLMAEIVAIPLTGRLTRLMSTRRALVLSAVDVDRPDRRALGSVDLVALPLLAGFLAGLQLLLKEAPQRSWASASMLLVAALCLACGGGVVRRSLRQPKPLIDLSPFRTHHFAAGCWFSFVLGIGLYGGTYLLPLFL